MFCLDYVYYFVHQMQPLVTQLEAQGRNRQSQVQNVERRFNESPERLALGLLLLLFTTEELSQGNCTKQVRHDIKQLDSERLWTIKC